MEEPKIVTECPRCHIRWSEEEIELQQCGGCGYPLYSSSTNVFDEFDDPDNDE